MSAGTASSNSNSSGNNSQSSNGSNSKYFTYQLPENVLSSVCYYLDQNNGWQEVAAAMGYAVTDFIVSFRFLLQFNWMSYLTWVKILLIFRHFKQTENKENGTEQKHNVFRAVDFTLGWSESHGDWTIPSFIQVSISWTKRGRKIICFISFQRSTIYSNGIFKGSCREKVSSIVAQCPAIATQKSRDYENA